MEFRIELRGQWLRCEHTAGGRYWFSLFTGGNGVCSLSVSALPSSGIPRLQSQTCSLLPLPFTLPSAPGSPGKSIPMCLSPRGLV